MSDNIIAFLLENGVKPEDLESIKVGLEEAEAKKREEAAAAKKLREDTAAAYDELQVAWSKYIRLVDENVDFKVADKILNEAIKVYLRYGKKPVVEKRGIKETYDAAKKKREKREMTDKEIDDFIDDFFGGWKIKF